MGLISLTILIFLPLLIGLVLLTPIFRGHEVLIRRFTKGFASLEFIYTLFMLVCFEPSENLAFYENLTFFGLDWIPALGIKASFGVDSLSLILVVLTSFIFLLAVIASKSNIRHKHQLYYSLIFILQSAVFGVFCARDMFLFFLFWELELIPMYFLISQWGHGNAKKSAMKFLLYTFIGSLFMLLGFLFLHYYNFLISNQFSADLAVLNVSSLPVNLQLLISILILIGFAVKLPIVPLHTWLPNAHVDAPTPISMILAAILLKMGGYGIIRFNMQLLPDVFGMIAPALIILALINIVYTAFIAYCQTDLKKIVAYSSISNMGIVLLGLSSMNLIGTSGAYFHMLSHGIISAGLFMIVGIIYNRTKTRDIAQLGGLVSVMPRLMAFSVILTFAAVGLPFTMGFIGEFLAFLGIFNSNFALIGLVALIILVLSVCYMLKFLHKTFFSNMFERWERVQDITTHEFFVLGALVGVVILFGIYPMSILNMIIPILDSIVQALGGI